MNEQTIQEVRRDPAAFRRHLLIDTDQGPRRLDGCLDDWQRRDFEALDPAWCRVAGIEPAEAPEPPASGDGQLTPPAAADASRDDTPPPPDGSPSILARIFVAVRRVAGHPDLPHDGIKGRAYLERPRGHSKTADLAVMVTWVLLASPRRLSGVAAAADKDQARLLRDAIAKLVMLNPWLASILDVQRHAIANLHTGSALEILSADAASSYGLTPDFVVVDELTHWPKEELWHSLLSSAAKRRHCLLIIIANAGLGMGESWQWVVRAAAEADPNWYFHSLNGPQASWIRSHLLDEQRRMLPGTAYDRLWLNRWQTTAGDALTADDVDGAIRADRPMSGTEAGCVFVAAVDVGHRHDKTAIVVLAADGASQTVRLAAVHEFAPGAADVCLMRVEECIISLNRQFRLQQVVCDPSQAVLLIQRLRAVDIRAVEYPFTGANMHRAASCLLDAFRSRRIVLYPHAGLLRGLRSLRIEEKQYGFRLTAPRDAHGHADAAIAFSIGLPTALELMQNGAIIDGTAGAPVEIEGIFGGRIPSHQANMPNPFAPPGPGNLAGFGGQWGGSISRF